MAIARARTGARIMAVVRPMGKSHGACTFAQAAHLMQILLDWAEQQFRAMGRRDAHDLAVELVASYEGSAVLASALRQPGLMTRQVRRLQTWIEALRA